MHTHTLIARRRNEELLLLLAELAAHDQAFATLPAQVAAAAHWALSNSSSRGTAQPVLACALAALHSRLDPLRT